MKIERIKYLAIAVAVILCGIWYSSYTKNEDLTFAREDKIYYDNIETIGSFNDMMKYDIININTADVLRLTELKGIGEKTAQKIIDYRTQNGSFESIEDIMNVEGIGDKTFEEIKDYITVEGVE
jgi:competence protein ComEA